MTRRTAKRLIVLASCLLPAVLAPGVLAAGADHAAPAAALGARSVVTFVATDFHFAGPDTFPAGLTTLRMVNQGAELHHIQLIRLPVDKTSADFFTALQQAPEHPPKWLEYAGGPSLAVPGEASEATLFLTPGRYLFLCFVGNQAGPHLAQGMVKEVTVTAPEPAADVTLNLLDYRFTVEGSFRAGTQTVRVVNLGRQPHEASLALLAPGATAAQFVEFVHRPAGPPPAKPLGGLQAIDGGKTGYFTVNLTPGRYVLTCFVPEEGLPHAQLGMVYEFEVR